MLSVGCLVTIAKFNLTLKKPVSRVDMCESPCLTTESWCMLRNEIALVIALDDTQDVAQILHEGRTGWCYQDELRELKI